MLRRTKAATAHVKAAVQNAHAKDDLPPVRIDSHRWFQAGIQADGSCLVVPTFLSGRHTINCENKIKTTHLTPHHYMPYSANSPVVYLTYALLTADVKLYKAVSPLAWRRRLPRACGSPLGSTRRQWHNLHALVGILLNRLPAEGLRERGRTHAIPRVSRHQRSFAAFQ
jgi:hypothetical protein